MFQNSSLSLAGKHGDHLNVIIEIVPQAGSVQGKPGNMIFIVEGPVF